LESDEEEQPAFIMGTVFDISQTDEVQNNAAAPSAAIREQASHEKQNRGGE
jgi:hypothetical protein